MLPMEVVTTNVVQTLAMAAAARQLAEEYDVEPSAAYEQNLANLEQAATPSRTTRARRRWSSSRGVAYVNDILEQIGRKTLAEDGVTEPTIEDATARGKELLSTWLAVNAPEIDPQYGLKLVEPQPELVDTDGVLRRQRHRRAVRPASRATRTRRPTPRACPSRSAAADPCRPRGRSRELAGRAARGDAAAARRVRLEARADAPVAGALPARGDPRDARGHRHRRRSSTCARSSATCCSRSTSTR